MGQQQVKIKNWKFISQLIGKYNFFLKPVGFSTAEMHSAIQQGLWQISLLQLYSKGNCNVTSFVIISR